jgi:hypothetical protein
MLRRPGPRDAPTATMVRGVATLPLPTGVPTAVLSPDTIPSFAPRASRLDRALLMLAGARTALGEALAELEARHPDDRQLAARLDRWHRTGGIPFR